MRSTAFLCSVRGSGQVPKPVQVWTQFQHRHCYMASSRTPPIQVQFETSCRFGAIYSTVTGSAPVLGPLQFLNQFQSIRSRMVWASFSRMALEPVPLPPKVHYYLQGLDEFTIFPRTGIDWDQFQNDSTRRRSSSNRTRHPTRTNSYNHMEVYCQTQTNKQDKHVKSHIFFMFDVVFDWC